MFGLDKMKTRKAENDSSLVIFGGNANSALAAEIATCLGRPLAEANIGKFPEGEVSIQIQENIRGKDVFIVQPTCISDGSSPNDNLMELLVLMDAAKRASAERITAVLPFFGYARQDRKDRPRVPITAKLIANLITKAGANRVLTMDLHAGQIQGFFDIPVDHLYSINVIGDYLLKKQIKDLVVVSPDAGGIKMARAYAKLLNASLAIVDKRRESASKTHVMSIIGDVRGKNAVIIDDLISTGGSLVEAAKALKECGALDIMAAIVHPVLVGPAIERIKGSAELKELVITNSIPLSPEKRIDKITQLSVAPLLADAIWRIHGHESVSALFSQVGVEA